MEAPLRTSGFRKGDIVVIPFPFSDLSDSKRRPALVVANIGGEDRILCQITSAARIDDYSITLNKTDFSKGSLSQISVVRPNKIFTADESIILYRAGTIKENKIKEVESALVNIFTQ